MRFRSEKDGPQLDRRSVTTAAGLAFESLRESRRDETRKPGVEGASPRATRTPGNNARPLVRGPKSRHKRGGKGWGTAAIQFP